MHLTSKTQLNCSSHFQQQNICHPVVASLLVASLLLFSDISAAQQSNLSSGDKHHHTWLNPEIWIADIGTLLYRDDDQDGYFSGFSLTIDADTYYQQAEIYVSIDVKRSFGERERLHTSANFTIYGDNVSDEYRIDIDLLANYQADDYDLYIDLHDAYNHQVLDSVSSADFSNLYRLPLESENLDQYYEIEHEADPVHQPNTPSEPVNADIRVVEYAGSSGFFLISAILSIVALRKSGSRRYHSR